MPHALVLAHADETAWNRAQLEDFTLVRGAGVEEAVNLLLECPPDLVVLAHLEDDPRGLELLSILDKLKIHIPVLVSLAPERTLCRPADLSPRLLFLEPGLPDARLAYLLRFALTDAPPAMAAPFRLFEYLALAVSFQLSVDLHLRCPEHGEILVSLVGGDFWCALCGDLEGEAALAACFSSIPLGVEAIPLRSLPRRRPMSRTGALVLQALCEPTAAPLPALPLQPAVPEPLRPASRPPAAMAAMGALEREVDRLCSEGLAAALAHDYPLAMARFEAARELKPHDSKVSFNLERLRRRLGASAVPSPRESQGEVGVAPIASPDPQSM